MEVGVAACWWNFSRSGFFFGTKTIIRVWDPIIKVYFLWANRNFNVCKRNFGFFCCSGLHGRYEELLQEKRTEGKGCLCFSQSRRTNITWCDSRRTLSWYRVPWKRHYELLTMTTSLASTNARGCKRYVAGMSSAHSMTSTLRSIFVL